MQVLGTIEQNFALNLRVLRGDRTQAEMAEHLGMPLRTYASLESGTIVPQAETRAKLAERLRESEGRLFADPDYVATPEEAVKILAKYVETARSKERELSASARALSNMLPTLDENKARTILDFAKRIRGQATDKLKKPRAGT